MENPVVYTFGQSKLTVQNLKHPDEYVLFKTPPNQQIVLQNLSVSV